MLLLAYPGYTVARIEDELSRRQVEELMGIWEKHPPQFVETARLRKAFFAAHKIKMTKPAAQLSDEQLLGNLARIGWL